MPLLIEYSSYWRFKSWDGFAIPKPFSKVEVTIMPFIEVALHDRRRQIRSRTSPGPNDHDRAAEECVRGSPFTVHRSRFAVWAARHAR